MPGFEPGPPQYQADMRPIELSWLGYRNQDFKYLKVKLCVGQETKLLALKYSSLRPQFSGRVYFVVFLLHVQSLNQKITLRKCNL